MERKGGMNVIDFFVRIHVYIGVGVSMERRFIFETCSFYIYAPVWFSIYLHATRLQSNVHFCPVVKTSSAGLAGSIHLRLSFLFKFTIMPLSS